MFDKLSAAERRQILLASRIRFGVETKVPRERAIERMIENALAVAREDEWFTPSEILDVFREIGGMPTLRLNEIGTGLARLLKSDRVEAKIQKPQNAFRLTKLASDEVQADFTESSRRLERILRSLYRGVLDHYPLDNLARFFLEFACEVFRLLGSQWVSYLKGDNFRSLVDLSDVERIADEKIRKYDFNPQLRKDIRRRSIEFFQNLDPDSNQLRFALAQSFYIGQLLGVEGRDLLSEEIFADGTLYLDSSVVIPALLPSSRHHAVFKELCGVCKRLRIRLLVARPTIDEVRKVAADQERLAGTLYEKVPQNIAASVKGDFFHFYLIAKQVDPESSTESLFAPFHRLSETLRETFGIETVDDVQFEEFEWSVEFNGVAEAIQKSSVSVRKREKFRAALSHDSKIFMFLRSQCSSPEEKVSFLTCDSSLPSAWAQLQSEDFRTRCFTLDGLLQSISPFVTTESEASDFSEVFSQVIAAQLLPQGKLFDIEDFMLFEDLDLDCRELPEAEVRDALLAVKEHVLKGAAYRHESLEEAAYELRRFFAQTDKRIAGLIKERERLQSELEERERRMQREQLEHSKQIGEAREEISELLRKEGERGRRRSSLRMLAKQAIALVVITIVLLGVTVAADKWGEGRNLFQRAESSWHLYCGALFATVLIMKVSLFRKQPLRDVFAAWAELRDLVR